jgi:mono/diheme cytochrome c family protein
MMWLSIAIFVAISAADSATAQEKSLSYGKSEYIKSCQPCHGATGKGDGPMAKQMARSPSDLTKLSESNQGAFPLVRVYEAIDGRLDTTMHGKRDMPVWGEFYERDVTSRTSRDSLPKELSDAFGRRRILEVVEYVLTLQSK